MYSAKGRIIQIMPIVTGISKTGSQWVRQQFVIETQNGKYIDRMAFDLWNMEMAFGVGSDVEVTFNVSSNEFNGKWFTNLGVVEVKQLVQAPQPTTYSYPQQQAPVTPYPQAHPQTQTPAPQASQPAQPVQQTQPAQQSNNGSLGTEEMNDLPF